MTYPSPAKIRIDSDRVVRIKIIRPKAYYSRAGIQALAQGVVAVRVDFTTPLVSAAWVIGSLSVVNSADPTIDVIAISAVLRSDPSQSGFDILLSTPPNSGNYKLHWSIAEEYDP